MNRQRPSFKHSFWFDHYAISNYNSSTFLHWLWFMFSLPTSGLWYHILYSGLVEQDADVTVPLLCSYLHRKRKYNEYYIYYMHQWD